jgi:hypothetical protein
MRLGVEKSRAGRIKIGHATTTVNAIHVSTDLADWDITCPVPGVAVSNNPGLSVIKSVPAGFDAITLSIPLSDLK